MGSSVSGIQNFDKMNDKDKAYVVKLLIILASSVIAGLVTGIFYSGPNDNPGTAGFIIFLATVLGSSFYIQQQYDLEDMSNLQIIRHAIAIGFLGYLFFWTTIYNFFWFN